MSFGAGLTRVPSDQLETVLRWVHQRKLVPPIRRVDLLACGLNVCAEHGDLLFGLDERGVRAVIAATLAERRRPMPPSG